ncbi:DNA helicase [Agrobacterium vitis]|uniref:AAA domain-containing protein n=1 Tax=Allorhizobium ampelinum TaxID=3025782 RepID=UPI001F21F7CB|nr:AAA domain-containing protein [Allorhizobium ampelinum]MCF1449904.1 DNA helicase [Allorhizobium ampelinum]
MKRSSKERANRRPPLEERFDLVGDAIDAGHKGSLRASIYDIEERASGVERTLKLWEKTGSSVDDDLRSLWLHEMRQVQRLMSYAGAQEVIVDLLEFVEDDRYFGIVLDRLGHPLSEKRKKASRGHWLRNLQGSQLRSLFWRNVRRIVQALAIVHAQGLVHGRVSAENILTEGGEKPDFLLTGFEWSLWLNAHQPEAMNASVGDRAHDMRAGPYSFDGDWRALGLTTANFLNATVRTSGEVVSDKAAEPFIALDISERLLIRRLVAPGRMDQLDPAAILEAIDDIVATLAQTAQKSAGAFVLTFERRANLGNAIYDITNGNIAIDEHRLQLEWVRADLEDAPRLIVARDFDGGSGTMRIVGKSQVYRIKASTLEGNTTWSVATCFSVQHRDGSFSIGDSLDHQLLQPIVVTGGSRDTQETISRLGPDMIDWSVFAGRPSDKAPDTELETVTSALILLQTLEGVVKGLEVYPIEILDQGRRHGRLTVLLRADPHSDRDRIAKRIGLSEGNKSLKRLFEEEQRESEAKWLISQSASLGGSGNSDVAAAFVDVGDHRGLRCYEFELDEPLPGEGPFFLRPARDLGTEHAIGRRLRNIKALSTRVDLAEMLSDPWRVRRSGRDILSEDDQSDEAFLDLDQPKRNALIALWSTLPSFFVVGPPGVGKTKLATEIVRRKFAREQSTRLLISAQGHDALDHLQSKVQETLDAEGIRDLLVVRSTTTSEKRGPVTKEDVHAMSGDILRRLKKSSLRQNLPISMQSRITDLCDATERPVNEKHLVDREQRSGIGALSSLMLDSANIVISTANSPDIERLVEDREQFDWVIIEEAAKATGPELIGPLMLSGRRLLIGDHNQLPPFEADRLVKILKDHDLTAEALALVPTLVGPLLRDGEIDGITEITSDPARLSFIARIALRLLQPFRTFVNDDEDRSSTNENHRAVSSTLTEQRRMDPAIASLVSKTFYHGTLLTEQGRQARAEAGESSLAQQAPLPKSPIVVIDFPHVSATKQAQSIERGRPRWHNPSEVDSVMDALRLLRSADSKIAPTLAVLTPYKAQVDKISSRLKLEMKRSLTHLAEFRSVRTDGSFVGTIDSFQGNEADVVVLSLVRNNPRTGSGALGFLRDPRRMNVAISRAKSQLIIVGSTKFLEEAVDGVNPDDDEHDLSFLTLMMTTLRDLAKSERNGMPLATFIKPDRLKD